MKVKLFLIILLSFLVAFAYSNDKGFNNENLTNNNFKFFFNYLTTLNENNSINVINYNDESTNAPILKKGGSIAFMIVGGISLGQSLGLSILGALDLGVLYPSNSSLNNSTALLDLGIGILSFTCSGIFLIIGLIFLPIGIYFYSKYYKTKKISFFINSIDNKNNIGISLKI